MSETDTLQGIFHDSNFVNECSSLIIVNFAVLSSVLRFWNLFLYCLRLRVYVCDYNFRIRRRIYYLHFFVLPCSYISEVVLRGCSRDMVLVLPRLCLCCGAWLRGSLVRPYMASWTRHEFIKFDD